MSLTEYVQLIWRRGWIALLAAVLTIASAWVFSRVQQPLYRSTASILVQPARTDFGLTQSAKILLRSYVAWMNTRDNAQAVIDAVQIDLTPEELLGKVSIASDDSRFVIQIEVKDQNGELANDIARVWANLFVQWRNTENQKLRKEDRVDALLLGDPTYSLYRPQLKINLLAGAVLGLLLGGVVIFILEYAEAGILRSPLEVERALGLSVLAAIPSRAARHK